MTKRSFHTIEQFNPRKTLLGLLGPEPTADVKRQVADFLSRVVGKDPPWTVAYIENIAADRQEAGGPIERALRAYWVHLNGGPPVAGAFDPVDVRARPGTVEPSSLILGRSTRCSECNIPIVPAVPNGETCSAICAGTRKVRLARERAARRKGKR